MPASGDARIDFEDEVTPGKNIIKGTAKTLIPCVVLFLTKFIFQHFNYGLILIGLNLFCVRLDNFVIRQVQLKRKFNSYKCVYTAVAATCVGLLSFHAFRDYKLWKVLIGYSIASNTDSLSWMIWLVIYGDSIIKLFALAAKCLLIPLGQFCCLFKRGCILSLTESTFKAYRLICGFQLIPYILATENSESVADSYIGYLLLAFFFGFKLFIIYGIFKSMSRIFLFTFVTPQFGPKSKEVIECDLSHQTGLMDVITLSTSNGEIPYREEDLLHWMSTFGLDPTTGNAIIQIPSGDGKTDMSVNVF